MLFAILFGILFTIQITRAQGTVPNTSPIACDAQSALRLADNSEEIVGISPEKAIFVDLGAAWCSLCKIYSPTTKASALRYGFTYIHIDWEKSREFVDACGITGAPTYTVFNNGYRFRTIQLPQWQNQGGSASQIDAVIKKAAEDLRIYP